MDNYQKENRIKLYNELILTVYLLCIIIFVLAVLFICDWDYGIGSIDLYLNSTSTILTILLIGVIGLFILTKVKSIVVGSMFITLLILIYIFIFFKYDPFLKTLVILPITLVSLVIGKKIGIILSILIGFTFACIDFFLFRYDLPNRYLEMDIILTGILLINAWLIGSMVDIEKITRNILMDAANKDGLTDLFNHRYFQVYLKKLSENPELFKTISLIFIDVDFFKYYNDTFGHVAGDKILSGIGAILKEESFAPVITARYGGDEFCMLLPGYNVSKASNLAKKIKARIESLNIDNISRLPTGKFTVSMGLANYPEHTSNINNIIDLADQALYKAKNMSKDNIELYYNVFEALHKTCNNSDNELLNSIRTLLYVINAKDRYTYGHSERVLKYSTIMAKELGMSEENVKNIQYGAYLHDIGKIEIDINILNLSQKLTKEEWAILKQHPYYGSEIVRPIKVLEDAIPLILYHHENFDGTGYPYGINGLCIPIGARIIRIADSFDAMTTDRPYKKAMSYNDARKELLANAGTMYDPELCKIFINVIKEEVQVS